VQTFKIDIDVHGEELEISAHTLKKLVLTYLRKDLSEPKLHEKYVNVTEVSY
jgi:hypothetical protein